MRVGSRSNKVIRHSAHRGYMAGAGATESLLLAGYVTKPMISRPARMELLAGTAASLVYDIAYGKSPDVSSERNATDVTSGGTPSGSMKPMLSDASIRWQLKNGYSMRATTEHACGVGYRLVKRKGKYVCVKK